MQEIVLDVLKNASVKLNQNHEMKFVINCSNRVGQHISAIFIRDPQYKNLRKIHEKT